MIKINGYTLIKNFISENELIFIAMFTKSYNIKILQFTNNEEIIDEKEISTISCLCVMEGIINMYSQNPNEIIMTQEEISECIKYIYEKVLEKLESMNYDKFYHDFEKSYIME